MKSHSFVERGMIHWRIVLTLCAVLVGFGVVSFLTMPRQEFPDFTIRQGLVVGVMPGATSKQVEEQVTRSVEDYLFSFKEVNKKKTYSVSKEGQVVVFVELNDAVNPPMSPPSSSARAVKSPSAALAARERSFKIGRDSQEARLTEAIRPKARLSAPASAVRSRALFMRAS